MKQRRSTVLELGDGKPSASFPSYRDVADYVLAEHELLSKVLFRWIRGGQMACLFARRLARDSSEWGWLSVVDTNFGTDDFPDVLEAWLDEHGHTAEAVQIIFPELVEPEHVARLVGELCQGERWHWEEIKWGDDGAVPDSFLCGLRWKEPGGDVSWVLGFAPYPLMPFTRRIEHAPFCALLLRPIPAGPDSDPRFPANPPGTMHLAMMPHGLSEEQSALIDEMTHHDREEYLLADGGVAAAAHAQAAKARVTFCFPEEHRRLLGEPGL